MKKRLAISILLIISLLSISISSYATIGSFSVSASSSINVGATTNLNITATKCGGRFTISSSDSSIVSISESSKWVETGSETITLTGKKAGTATITVTASDVGDTSPESAKVTGSKTVKITVKDSSGGGSGGGTPTPTKATMTKVKVGDTSYSKNLSKGITIKVKNDITSIKVTPTISNGESYTINGGSTNTVKLEEGTNTVTIKLASGNTYKVYIRREAKEDDTPNIIDEKVLLKSLKIEGFTLDPEFSSEVYEYTLTIDEEHNDLEKLNIEAIGELEDYTVEITGNENLVEGENTITITVKSKDGEKVATYKIIVTKVAKAVVTSAEPLMEVNQELVIEPRWSDTQKILITIFTSIIALMGIGYAVIEYRYGKEKKENEMGEIPFAKIGFEKEETDKQDILSKEEIEEVEESEEYEKIEKETKPKKGKHF